MKEATQSSIRLAEPMKIPPITMLAMLINGIGKAADQLRARYGEQDHDIEILRATTEAAEYTTDKLKAHSHYREFYLRSVADKLRQGNMSTHTIKPRGHAEAVTVSVELAVGDDIEKPYRVSVTPDETFWDYKNPFDAAECFCGLLDSAGGAR